MSEPGGIAIAPTAVANSRNALSVRPVAQWRVGIALSGGGFRAASFHLGVLKRLDELGILREVQALSCVSGGSMTGALYALRCAEHGAGAAGTYPIDALIAEMRPVITSNLRGRALFGTAGRAWRTLWSFVSTRTSRIGLMADELDRAFYRGAPLNRLPTWVLLNATNLRTGKGWKFYGDRAGDYLVGATDDTAHIRVADAVGASAAYPGLTDAYGFQTHWDQLRGDLLEEGRWERPGEARRGHVSRWRRRYGAPHGPVTLPLVDGGIYDNEGLNGLWSARVTHAVLSSTTPPEGDPPPAFGPFRFLRIIDVMHDRLGAATRQLAHEMTHAVHPGAAGAQVRDVAVELRALSATLSDGAAGSVVELAARLDSAARVGAPSRGHQFMASAPVLLNKTDLAHNAFRDPARGNLDVPPDDRGLDPEIVDELARVRTDLDALEPSVFDLLVAQGYFLADAYAKVCMPDVVRAACGVADVRDPKLRPDWAWAAGCVGRANANADNTAAMIAATNSARGIADAIVGRCADRAECRRYLRHLVLTSAPVVLLALAVVLPATVLAVLAVAITAVWAVLSGLIDPVVRAFVKGAVIPDSRVRAPAPGDDDVDRSAGG